MLSAPIARSQILLGKLVARGILGILQTILLFGVAGLFLHTHYGNAPLGIILVGLSTIFAATGLGLLIATFAKTPEQIQSTTTLLTADYGRDFRLPDAAHVPARIRPKVQPDYTPCVGLERLSGFDAAWAFPAGSAARNSGRCRLRRGVLHSGSGAFPI